MILAFISKRLALWEKRRELRKIDEHLGMLWDQLLSAKEGIRRYEAKKQRIEEQIAAIEPPDDLVRRISAGA